MAAPPPIDLDRPRRLASLAVLREIVALVLIVAGVVGLLVACWSTSTTLGVATTSVLAITVGAYLSRDR